MPLTVPRILQTCVLLSILRAVQFRNVFVLFTKHYILPHLRFSPGLAPSDLHLFWPLKDALRGTRFEDDESVIHAVREDMAT